LQKLSQINELLVQIIEQLYYLIQVSEVKKFLRSVGAQALRGVSLRSSCRTEVLALQATKGRAKPLPCLLVFSHQTIGFARLCRFACKELLSLDFGRSACRELLTT
jgi:hypothetical protein